MLSVLGSCIYVDIWAYRNIDYITSQDWAEAQCVVHGMWLSRKDRWVSGTRHHRGHYEDYYQEHFEVEVVGKPWQRIDACYYASCKAAEDDSEDTAADELDEILLGACGKAGYSFDDGAFDFVDTDRTKAILEMGLNCALSDAVPDSVFSPSPPAMPTATTLPNTAPVNGYANNGYVVNSHGQVQNGLQPSTHMFPGARLGGKESRTQSGPPCICNPTYPCWYNTKDDGTFPEVKMTVKQDPIWMYILAMVVASICWVCGLCAAIVKLCAQNCELGPLSTSSKFERAWSKL